MVSSLLKVNNTALAQVIVLPSPGSADYESVINKIMSCHICYGKIAFSKTEKKKSGWNLAMVKTCDKFKFVEHNYNVMPNELLAIPL